MSTPESSGDVQLITAPYVSTHFPRRDCRCSVILAGLGCTRHARPSWKGALTGAIAASCVRDALPKAK